MPLCNKPYYDMAHVLETCQKKKGHRGTHKVKMIKAYIRPGSKTVRVNDKYREFYGVAEYMHQKRINESTD